MQHHCSNIEHISISISILIRSNYLTCIALSLLYIYYNLLYRHSTTQLPRPYLNIGNWYSNSWTSTATSTIGHPHPLPTFYIIMHQFYHITQLFIVPLYLFHRNYRTSIASYLLYLHHDLLHRHSSTNLPRP